ncbi:hypothetical protein DERP_001515 [Dermatophagoides pteronyssinus]|uniref:Uncharacterized protein n=1 Tax=Dermatophagoides pteronyssinus TaxID=6956 RepID=A0ABQ8JEQ5_DERPT|nr:hypothetical protein DERP_001515 [Dermatophagoides pteronyssinus]
MFDNDIIESYLATFQRKFQRFRHWLSQSRWILLIAFIISSLIIICVIMVVWSIMERQHFQGVEKDEIMRINFKSTTMRSIVRQTTTQKFSTEFDFKNNHFKMKKICDYLCKHDPELGGKLCDCDEPPCSAMRNFKKI